MRRGSAGRRRGAERRASAGLLAPPPDPADARIGHLVGLSLSRAAALRRIAAALPGDDPRTAVLEAAARDHLVAGLPHCVSGDFTADPWLATFAAPAPAGPPAGHGTWRPTAPDRTVN
ncbi:DUF2891 family protein [Streptomyces lydicus]|uniref:DUF2891 family protein n=1 Tax=Streptomyces lydicus TaxID=47763 RepID=UPI0037A387CF